MFKGIKGIGAIAAAGLLVVAIAYSGRLSGQPSAAGGDPGERLRVTLDPQQFEGNVRQAYEVAARDPGLLAQLHCYCGCDKAEGHKNLLDCYRDTHGSRCAICLGEALDAEPMANKGMTVEQIRDELRARYAHGS